MDRNLYLYVGNWNHITGNPGISLFHFSEETGDIQFVKLIDSALSCGSSYFDEKRGVIYFANETRQLPGCHGGGSQVVAYKIVPQSGDLEELSRAPSLCPNTTYVSLNPEGDFLVVANHSGSGTATVVKKDENGKFYTEVYYDDATINLYEVKEDGGIGALLDVAKHTGSSIGKKQFHSHPHSVFRSPLYDIYVVCDKGDDCIYMYRIDREEKKLKLLQDPPYKDIAGSIPRYSVFHPQKPYLYCNHEGNFDIHVYEYTPDGEITFLDAASVVPKDRTLVQGGRYEQQDMKISESGQYIYNLIHGPNLDAVSVMEVQESDGSLKLVQMYDLKGKWPRWCIISPNKQYMLIGCLVSGSIEVCRIEKDGKLSYISEYNYMAGIACLTLVDQECLPASLK